MNVKVLVLCGDGINCEKESAQAFNRVGAQSTIIHINDLLLNKSILSDYQILCLPGGFSFGDELGSGQILAHKIKHGLEQEFYKFVDDKKPIIGICNGFQVLTKLGLLPDYKTNRSVALAHNLHGQFIDQWVDLSVESKSVCHWTKGLVKLSLPIRHGEGRIVFTEGKEKEIFEELNNFGQIVLTYDQNPNGSYHDIAGICDKEGLIFGLMPHPEAAIANFSHPNGHGIEKREGDGLAIFKNIMEIL